MGLLARRRAGACASALLLLAGQPGCGLLFLTHDKMLGKVSPAGRLHPFATGTGVRIGRNGPESTIDPRENPFRAYPPDVLRHMARTPLMVLYGFQFYLGFVLRYVLQREFTVGRSIDLERLARIQADPGAWDEARVVQELGPPRLWVRRPEGSVMLYSSSLAKELGVSIGAPPGIGSLIPIPGVGEILRFDYGDTLVSLERTLLFFGPDHRLRSVAARDPVREEEEQE